MLVLEFRKSASCELIKFLCILKAFLLDWLSVPSPHSLPSTSAAIGASSLWVVTSDSRVRFSYKNIKYSISFKIINQFQLFVAELHPPFRHSDPSDLTHQFSLVDPDSYIEVGSKVSRPSINSYDQVHFYNACLEILNRRLE